MLLFEDLDRPSFGYIKDQIDQVAQQEKAKYEAMSLAIISEDSDKLADLQRKVVAAKVKYDCYQAILYTLFDKESILKNINALTQREKEDVR